ncbi:MAG: lytic murein transglycosylase B [Methylococcales bacterium]
MEYCRIFSFHTASLLLLFLLIPLDLSAGNAISPNVAGFIKEMAAKHQFDPKKLESTFGAVEIKQGILRAISKPAEKKPWYEYRKIFLTRSRINGGVKFWKNNDAILTKAQTHYGVPPAIIVAIIGVETRYGENTGGFRVIDALSTLAFHYPKRSKFFRSELKEFLLLCREEKMDPLQPQGSYAGAMGIPQFMPSSFRYYATDFDGDKKRDIWKNKQDVIGSIANYFTKHGWQRNKPIAYPAAIQKNKNLQNYLADKSLKPDRTIGEFDAMGVTIQEKLPFQTKAKLLAFERKKVTDYWIGLQNFWVITRYNHSQLYALAVFQLSQEILRQHNREAKP